MNQRPKKKFFDRERRRKTVQGGSTNVTQRLPHEIKKREREGGGGTVFSVFGMKERSMSGEFGAGI